MRSVGGRIRNLTVLICFFANISVLLAQAPDVIPPPPIATAAQFANNPQEASRSTGEPNIPPELSLAQSSNIGAIPQFDHYIVLNNDQIYSLQKQCKEIKHSFLRYQNSLRNLSPERKTEIQAQLKEIEQSGLKKITASNEAIAERNRIAAEQVAANVAPGLIPPAPAVRKFNGCPWRTEADMLSQEDIEPYAASGTDLKFVTNNRGSVVRAEAKPFADQIDLIPPGQPVRVTHVNGVWYVVEYADGHGAPVTGWVMGTDLAGGGPLTGVGAYPERSSSAVGTSDIGGGRQ